MGKIDDTVCVVRLLNSPFSGCEYGLSQGRTLFVIGGDTLINEGNILVDLPKDTLFIPFENNNVNFEVLCNEDNSIVLSELKDGIITRKEFEFNQPVEIESLRISIRMSNDKWEHQIVTYSELDEKVKYHNRKILKRILFLFVALFIITASSYIMMEERSEIKSISTVLGDNFERLDILKGHDGIIYILAKNEYDYNWMKKTLKKNGITKRIRVTSYSKEIGKFDRLMEDFFPNLPYYRFQIGTAANPYLWISKQVVSEKKNDIDVLKKN